MFGPVWSVTDNSVLTSSCLNCAAGEVLSLAHAISAVNQGIEHLTVPKDGDKEKELSKFAQIDFLVTVQHPYLIY